MTFPRRASSAFMDFARAWRATTVQVVGLVVFCAGWGLLALWLGVVLAGLCICAVGYVLDDGSGN